MTNELINTTKGTARIMDSKGMLEDLNIGIVETYKFLTTEQRDDLYNYASTEISEDQENSIRGVI